MSSPEYSYAREKIGLAVNELALHPGRIQERLERAFRHLIAVKPGDFPPGDLRDDFATVDRVRTRVQGPGGGGHLLSDDEAVKVARRLIYLESMIAD